MTYFIRLDAEFRKAILIANRNVEKQLRQDRAELMRGGEDALRRRHHESGSAFALLLIHVTGMTPFRLLKR